MSFCSAQDKFGSQSSNDDFSAFNSDVVSLGDDGKKKKKKKSQEPYILESAFPFCNISDTGGCVMVQCIDLVSNRR